MQKPNYLLAGLAGSILLLGGLVSCNKNSNELQGEATMAITISHAAAGTALELNKDVTTPNGEPIRYTVFKYYLSHMELVGADGSVTQLPVSYYLVDESKPASKNLAISIPAGSFKALRFLIGVDSARNVSGVQEGALDPANGMFWTWNSGYIMAKLEGKSPISPAPLQNITFHIGGFRVVNSVLKSVELPFGKTVDVPGKSQLRINMQASVDKWWAGKHYIRIADGALIMEPGPEAMRLADNYANMFTLTNANAF